MKKILLLYNFRMLFGSSIFSALGDAIYLITISWYIAQTYNSGTLMGSILLVIGIARFILGLIGGVIVDSIGSKKVMLMSDIIRSFLVFSLLLLFVFYHVPVWFLFFTALFFGIIDGFYWPAAEAMKVKVIDKTHFSKANSIYFTCIRFIDMFAPVIGGFLLSFTSYFISLGSVCVLYIFSAVCILFMKIKENVKDVKNKNDAKDFYENFTEGWKFIRGKKILLILIVTMFFANIGANGTMILFPFLVKNMGLHSDSLGIMYSAMSLGSFGAGILFSLKSYKNPSIYIIMCSFLGQGLLFSFIYWTHNFYFILFLLFVEGIFSALLGIFIPTIVQLNVPENYMGRIGGMIMSISMASTPFASFLFGFLQDIYGAHKLFLISGLVEVGFISIVLFYLKLIKVSNKVTVSETKINHAKDF